MAGPDSIVINDGFAKLRRGRLRKDGSRGKGRVTIEIESEPLLHVFDDVALGRGPAEAIREILIDGIRAIGETASAATLKHRAKAVRAFQRGTRWATKRYSGGRTGATPPQPNENRAFNFSGRLQRLAVSLNGDTFTINVPANRFDPTQYRSLGRLEAALTKLRSLVPAMDPRNLARDRRFQEALSESVDNLIQKARNERDLKLKELRAAGAVLRGLAGIAA